MVTTRAAIIDQNIAIGKTVQLQSFVALFKKNSNFVKGEEMKPYEDLGSLAIPVTDRLFCCHSPVITTTYSLLIVANQKPTLAYGKMRGE